MRTFWERLGILLPIYRLVGQGLTISRPTARSQTSIRAGKISATNVHDISELSLFRSTEVLT